MRMRSRTNFAAEARDTVSNNRFRFGSHDRRRGQRVARDSLPSPVVRIRPAAEEVLTGAPQQVNRPACRLMAGIPGAARVTPSSRCEQVAGAGAAEADLGWFTAGRGLA